jgi:hypothetical protein
MDNLTLDEIIYITRFLNLKNTFNFIKSLKWQLDPNLKKSILIKNKKIMVIEHLFNAYGCEHVHNPNLCASGTKGTVEQHVPTLSLDQKAYLDFSLEDDLKELIQFFHNDIDVEDLICFMANIYPNRPKLKDTILFDLLKLYNFSEVDWSLIRVHFKL